MNKYFNDAIIGNSSILASLNKKGELLRFFSPNIDFMNHIEEHKVALVLDNDILWLDNDNIFSYEQAYIENTNILNTRIYNENISLLQTDYIDINNNVLIRKYNIERINLNISNIDLVIYSNLVTNETTLVSGWYNEELNALIQYSKDSYFTTFSNNKIINYQINNSREIFNNLYFNQKDYIGMSCDSVIRYHFNDNKELKIYMCHKDSMFLIKNMINLMLLIDEKLLFEETKSYWENVIKKCNIIEFKNVKEKEIYIRSILLLLLYTNDKTAGMIASCEVDEKLTRCGRYGYCWPRDSAYLIEALNICGLNFISERFYTIFCITTQFENGKWEQRYYTDGNLAPCWGEQLDETATVIIGMIKQYKLNKDEKYLLKIKKSLDKAVEYILKVIDVEENIASTCYDLWEMNEGKHLYTTASIYYALKLYVENVYNPKLMSLIKIKLGKLYANIFDKYWRDELGYFKRNTVDDIVDVSVLALIWPFEIINILDDKVVKTVNKIEEKLKCDIGGIHRFENDHYMDNNPWIIATLWVSMYYIKKYKITKEEVDYVKAKEYFDFVTNHASLHGLLAEQIDKSNGNPLWVNGLAWSHAMYVICAKELYE